VRIVPRLAATTVLAGSVWAVPGPAAADQVLCSDLDSEVVVHTDGDNRPYADMRVADAQLGGTGRGVTVAVIDSGVASHRWLPDVSSHRVAGSPEALDLPTMVAGLIAGRMGPGRRTPLGLAPAARILDVKVYDGPDAGPPPSAASVAEGIRAAVSSGADVIEVSTATEDADGLRAAVRLALAADVVVVAAIGERPQDGQPGYEEWGSPEPGENVQTFPAAYPGVLGVSIGSADGVDQSGAFPRSDAIDVVAPVTGAVTTTRNGSTCVVDAPTTAMAAGEVAGLAAILRDRYERYTNRQIAALIMATASQTTAQRSLVDGFGTIQPYDAMNRQLRIRPNGTVVQAHQQVDRAPRVRPPDAGDDPFRDLRSSLMWWGVLAGGGLLLALLGRPLIRR